MRRAAASLGAMILCAPLLLALESTRPPIHTEGPLSIEELAVLFIQAAEDGDYVRSIDARTLIEGLAPLSADQEVTLARAYLAADTQDYGRAREALARARKLGAKSVTLVQLEGLVAYALGEKETAQSLLAGAKSGGHRDVQVHSALGELAMEAGQPAAALAEYAAGSALAVGAAEPHFKMAQALLSQGDTAKALAALDNAISLDASHRGARLMRGRQRLRSSDQALVASGRIDLQIHTLLLARWDLSSRDPDDVEAERQRRRIASDLMELEPKNSAWPLQFAESLARAGGTDREIARDLLAGALLQVQTRAAHADGAGVAFLVGDLELAQRLAVQALDAKTDLGRLTTLDRGRESRAATLMANLLMRKGEFTAAAPHLARGIELYPYRSDLRALAGALASLTSDTRGAEREYGIALQLGSTDAQVRKRLGALLLEGRRFKEALPHLEAALLALPRDQEIPELIEAARRVR